MKDKLGVNLMLLLSKECGQGNLLVKMLPYLVRMTRLVGCGLIPNLLVGWFRPHWHDFSEVLLLALASPRKRAY